MFFCGDARLVGRAAAVCNTPFLEGMSCATAVSTSTFFDRATGHTTQTSSSVRLLTATVVLVGPVVEVIFIGHASTNVGAIFVLARTTRLWFLVFLSSMDTKAATTAVGLPRHAVLGVRHRLAGLPRCTRPIGGEFPSNAILRTHTTVFFVGLGLNTFF